jgi:hypothetical protein
MNRLLVIEVPDVDTEDNIRMAIAIWNEEHPHERIRMRQTGLIVGEPFRPGEGAH